ncbi:MAG: TetR/AcrR family transcriptional regulator [Gemmataceae bacterium]
MVRTRGEVGRRRREQIVEAAVAIIAEEGLHHLSLSAIEARAGMSRGQLTYYFPTKEDILLAVFDRLLAMMHERADCPAGEAATLTPWQRLRAFLEFLILRPPEVREFHALQYTFLSQIGYRDDFRQRLADLYEHWRSAMAADLAHELPAADPAYRVDPRTLATFVQALLHGLAIQRVADPAAYDRTEMLKLCLHFLGLYLGKPDAPSHPAAPLAGGGGARNGQSSDPSPRGTHERHE